MSSSPEPQQAPAHPQLSQPADPSSCIKVLVATDNHIGYAEKDPVRGRDSINTFREILDLAVANDVDMLLLAGDLFHENRPSRTALYQTISALRERCLGDRPVSLELVSDAGVGIARDATWPGVNYEDYNINVSLPVFSIHGNHDDPQGVGAEGALCALDLLSASGVINYFGRMELPGQATDDAAALEDGLKVKPVLLQKGDTKLALYGMGNIRDDRFVFELTNRRINLYRPAEDPEDWFNIVLVHQNRVPHGPNNSVPETAFGEEANVIIWGHEHDCVDQARPVPVTGRPYYISQPGSSVATSLAKGEAIPKHVGLLRIQGKEFDFEPIRLRSVRPFVFDEVSLSDHHEAQTDDRKKLNTKVAVNKYLKAKVNELIDRANKEWDDLNPDKDEDERLLPLIRLRVDYSHGPNGDGHFEVGNPQRFGQDFIDRVANPRDVVQFHRKAATRKQKVSINEPELADLADALADADAGESAALAKVTVSSLVHDYLDAQNLNVLSESLIQNAVEEFVGKGDKDAVGNWVKKLLKDTRNEIIKKGYEPSKDGPEHDDLEAEMAAAKKRAEEKYGAKNKGKGRAAADEEDESEEDEDEFSSGPRSKIKSKGKAVGKGKGKACEPDSMNDDSDASMASSTVGKGKKKAAPKKAIAKKAPAKGKGKNLFNNSDDDEEESEEEAPKKKVPAKKAPVKKTVASSSSTRKTPARSSASTTKKKPQETITLTDSESDDSSAEEAASSRKRKRIFPFRFHLWGSAYTPSGAPTENSEAASTGTHGVAAMKHQPAEFQGPFGIDFLSHLRPFVFAFFTSICSPCWAYLVLPYGVNMASHIASKHMRLGWAKLKLVGDPAKEAPQTSTPASLVNAAVLAEIGRREIVEHDDEFRTGNGEGFVLKGTTVPILVQHVGRAIEDRSSYTDPETQQLIRVNNLRAIRFPLQKLVKPFGEAFILALDQTIILYTYFNHWLEMTVKGTPEARVAMFYLATFATADLELREVYPYAPERWLFAPGRLTHFFKTLPEGKTGGILSQKHWKYMSMVAPGSFLQASAVNQAKWDVAQPRLDAQDMLDPDDMEVDMDALAAHYMRAYTHIIGLLEVIIFPFSGFLRPC
ncbi:hypothetical protein JCM11641_003229 [Rhodosporidiobolus odoratus]